MGTGKGFNMADKSEKTTYPHNAEIDALRRKAGVTFYQLALELGKTEMTLYRWFKNKPMSAEQAEAVLLAIRKCAEINEKEAASWGRR